MNISAILTTAALSAALLAPPASAPAAEAHEMHITKGMTCEICGMYIEVFRRTATEVAFDDGMTNCYCGVACTLRAVNERLGLPHVKVAHVTDWETQAAVPLDQAVLVVGSDLTPDMIPNYIAFRSAPAADAFRQAHGGTAVPLEEALAGISYAGMTMPFRVTAAPTPPERVFSVGVTVSRMVKDNLLAGDDDVSTSKVLATRPMAPAKMKSVMTAVAAGYAVSDDLYLMLVAPYTWKEMTVRRRVGDRVTFKEDGFGDTAASARWRFWHDELHDRHLAVVVKGSLPTGSFVEEHRARSGLQLGTEAFAAGGGLLYSHHIGLFWLNAGVEYLHNMENATNYQFGDVATVGLAVHLTPSTRTMLGVEVDASKVQENEDRGRDVANTGCEAVYGNLVAQRRVALFLGGNFDLRALVGVPLYEDVEGVQLGEKYHMAAGVQWKRRF